VCGIVSMDEAGSRVCGSVAGTRRKSALFTLATGDVVLGQSCLVHRAVANYEMRRYRRVLLRVVVKGSAPF
jgi:hypothetical protein